MRVRVLIPARATADRGKDVPHGLVSLMDARGTRHRTATAQETVATPLGCLYSLAIAARRPSS
ncbi:hypothetical protein OG257_00195 [Streptomyces sp. NBC_00683]|uniref:hypothetical protein n=1 Tax=Streptomyces sp. NBC_00683 TaxID=2903670 RepID=UPI002E329CC0|nr:hypothetical protein [Streptomyces sp. NBC_00683]